MIQKDKRVFLSALLLSILLHLFCVTSLKLPFDRKDSKLATICVTLTPKPDSQILLKPKTPVAKKTIPLDIKTENGSIKETNRNKLITRYLFYLREKIEKNKYQPRESRFYRLIGNTKVGFEILPNGRFDNIRTLGSSGDNLLDQTALKAISFTDGTYKRPAWTGREKLEVVFVLKYQYGL